MNERKITVSIVIATFNAGKTIGEALESVLQQTFQGWECIVVDGSSTDDTVRIVESYCAKDSRFSYISEPDNGVYDAFNKGWRMAKGEWVHYLGADDSLTRESFTALLQGDNASYDVVSGGCWIRKVDGTVKKQMSQGFDGCHQAKITRRAAIERYGGFDLRYKIVADYDLYVRMRKGGVRVRNVDTMVARFTMDGMSQRLSNLWRWNKEIKAINERNGIPYGIFAEARRMVYVAASILYRKVLSFLNSQGRA